MEGLGHPGVLGREQVVAEFDGRKLGLKVQVELVGRCNRRRERLVEVGKLTPEVEESTNMNWYHEASRNKTKNYRESQARVR